MKRTGARGNHSLSPEGIAQGASILFTETPRSWAAVGWSGRSGVVARPPMPPEHRQHLEAPGGHLDDLGEALVRPTINGIGPAPLQGTPRGAR
jgi:hypothetical protein